MRLGLGLMNAGESSSYASLSRVAQQAEALGYDSLWVTESEPFPLAAHAQHPVFTGELIVSRKGIASTFEALAVAAVHTSTIRLGISLPNVPFYSPIAVGQSLAALDVLSDGRVQVGLGLGWSASEFETVRSGLSRPDSPASEFVRALRTVWDCRAKGFTGGHYVIPRSACKTEPVQQPHPPVVLTAFAPAAIQPSAMLLRGGSPLSAVLSSEEMAEALQSVAQPVVGQFGTAELVVRAVIRLTNGPLGESRAMFTGSLDQIRDDIAFVHSVGAAELQIDLSQMPADRENAHPFDLMSRLSDLVPATMRMSSPAFSPVSIAAWSVVDTNETGQPTTWAGPFRFFGLEPRS